MNEKNGDYVKATSDIFIKYLFGMDNEESNRLVLSFINAVLQDSGFPAITKVIQKNPFNYKEFLNDKLSVLDIKVENENKKIFNVEVQSSGDRNFHNRALYYWSKLYTSQLKNTDGYKGLVPTIGINILKFILLPELPGFHNFFMITEAREKEYILTDHLVIHFLELPKIENLEISSKIDRWLLYLKKEGKDDEMLKILIKDDDDLKLAHKKYETFTNDKKLRWLAIDREKAERDKIYHENMTKFNEAEVMAKGLEQGIEQGIGQERLETTKKMLAEGLDIKMISHISGLSIEEIEKLKP